jgi:hypothetical protein
MIWWEGKYQKKKGGCFHHGDGGEEANEGARRVARRRWETRVVTLHRSHESIASCFMRERKEGSVGEKGAERDGGA